MVSPFISLPTATTLPYTYKSLPSTLPPSSTGDSNGIEKPKYVISSSGHAAHPDEIIASCQTLRAHIQKLQDDAEKTLQNWEKSIQERDLAEKRRVAPGWLDREEKILEPERKRENILPDSIETGNINLMDNDDNAPMMETMQSREGEQLDRAFGAMGMQ